MGFASSYLEQRALFPEIIKEAPDEGTGIIVVIPSYDEPGIAKVLDSLASCNKPPCGVEVLVIVNAPEGASAESLGNNLITLEKIEAWKRDTANPFFRLFAFHASPPPVRKWGVGAARKTGMDEAARRFDRLGRPDGVILSLDADCTVDPGYLEAVHNGLLIRKERSACSVYFEHPLEGTDFPEAVYRSVILYELHLRYYLQALRHSGFPEAFHTVGSATAVKALSYVRAGGMNRRQAGEDFYFIQKLIPAGGYFTLDTTAVYPSPRSSFRVPFGTGAAIGRLTGDGADGFLTYNLMAFLDLASLFSMTEALCSCAADRIQVICSQLPASLRSCIPVEEFTGKIEEIRRNTSGYASFRKRFFVWFNMFRVVRYLNQVHPSFYPKTSVIRAAAGLLALKGINAHPDSPAELLARYRQLERML